MNNFSTISHKLFFIFYSSELEFVKDVFHFFFLEMDCEIFGFVDKMWENVEM